MIRWSRRIIYGDRFVRPRFAERHLARWDDTLVWAYDAIADNIVWGNDGNIVWGNDDNIVWGNAADDNIVWGNDETDNLVWGVDDNIVWGNADNIVWGNSHDDNIVWGNSHLREVWAANVVVGFWDGNIVWGNITRATEDNIVWGDNADNIVLGRLLGGRRRQHCLGQRIAGDNIVWGNCQDPSTWLGASNIVWGNAVLTGGRR